jgi:hypothetical protein
MTSQRLWLALQREVGLAWRPDELRQAQGASGPEVFKLRSSTTGRCSCGARGVTVAFMPTLAELIAAADPEDVGVFAAFVLLPHTVALNGLSVFGNVDGGPFPGWDAKQMRALVWDRDLQPGRRTICRVQFRDAHGGGGSRAEMVDRRFPDMVDRLLPERDRRLRQIRNVAASWRWRREQTTAAAITLLLGSDELTRFMDDPERVLVERCVGLLNTYLTALGMAGNDPLIGGLALADLATPVDFVFELRTAVGVRSRLRDKVGIHLWDEQVLALPRDPEKLTAAAHLFRASREGDDPAYPVYAFRQEAVREVLAGRRDYAIVLATLAIEVLVNLCVATTWIALGLPGAELPAAMEENFVRRLRMVRDRMFPTVPAVAQATDRWLTDCYEARDPLRIPTVVRRVRTSVAGDLRANSGCWSRD